jgi:predicted DNA-binding WGR domain protein
MSIDATADHQDPLDREPDGMADLIGVMLRRIDPAKNMARFYAMEVQLDLFGAIMLMKQWGRHGTGGRIAGEPYASVALAVNALERQAARKRRRGYQ